MMFVLFQDVTHHILLLQRMEVGKFWDLMIAALQAANKASPLNK